MYRLKLIFLFLILYPISIFSQYIGIGLLYDSDQIQIFNMNSYGNITFGGRLTTGNAPGKITITDDGLVLITNYGYSQTQPQTLTVLKIDNTGLVSKVRDVDFGGRGYAICTTKDFKYVIINHRYELFDDSYDYGFSVLRITESDVKMPPIQFLSLKDLQISSINFDVNQNGVLLGVTNSPLEIYNITDDGYLTYTYNNIPITLQSTTDIEFTKDSKRCFIARLNNLAVIDVDENKNVSLWGYVNYNGKGAHKITITPNSRLVLGTILNESCVAIFRNNEDGTVTFKDKIDTEIIPQPIDITPDGKFAVVGSGYVPGSCTLSVLKINPDETIIHLQDKDVLAPEDMWMFALYKLPETSVNKIWEMYK